MFANEVFKVCKFAEFSSSFTLFCCWLSILSGENTASDSFAHGSLLSEEALRFDSCLI